MTENGFQAAIRYGGFATPIFIKKKLSHRYDEKSAASQVMSGQMSSETLEFEEFPKWTHAGF